MPFLTQSRFPRLWSLFQCWIGGTIDKRHLCLLKYDGKSNVLEVGCSLGNIAKAFLKFDNIEYTGVDIDPVVINYARRSFTSRKNFKFLCEDLRLFPTNEAKFGYVLFAGVCHHLDDYMCMSLLAKARELVDPQGKLVVVDPLIPTHDDSWFLHLFIKIEQGIYLRNGEKFRSMLEKIPGFRLDETEEHFTGCSPFHLPRCARFGVYTLKPI